MYPHRIRLRAPWECEPLSAGQIAGLADNAYCFRRRFGYPGRIDAHERVWLTFAGIAGVAEVRLNDVALGQSLPHNSPHFFGEIKEGTFEFEVTALLRPRNELVVDVAGTAERDGLGGEVALEVRCSAFLRELSWFAIRKEDRAELHVMGQVVGMAESPLELYIVLNRSVVAYQMVTATAEGQSFEIIVPDLAMENSDPVVKVDLVNGASVWYTSEGSLPFEPMSSLGK